MNLELNDEYDALWEEIQVYIDYTNVEVMNSGDKKIILFSTKFSKDFNAPKKFKIKVTVDLTVITGTLDKC